MASPLNRFGLSAFIGDELIMLCEQTARDEPPFASFECSHSSTPSPEFPPPGPNLSAASICAHPLLLNDINKREGLIRDWNNKFKTILGLDVTPLCDVMSLCLGQSGTVQHFFFHTISRLPSARPGKHILRFPGLHESGKDWIRKKMFSLPLLLLS